MLAAKPMTHQSKTESVCAREASAIWKVQINGAARSATALIIFGSLIALGLQGCAKDAESKPSRGGPTTTRTTTTTTTTREAWAAAPTDISDVKHENVHLATSLKDAGLDDVTLPARENFLPSVSPALQR